MKCLKKMVVSCVAGMAAVGFWASNGRAEIVGAVDWADGVAAYSSRIQNYGGTAMSDATTWWVTGEPDADVDGNGYAWDGGDLDYVAGWRTIDADQYITLYWQNGISDVAGDDVVIRMFGGPKSAATVSASSDGVTFTDIGSLGTGEPGYLRNEYFDLNGLFSGQTVSYVKVLRDVYGPQTGMFFDAVGGAAVPEPGTIALLAAATAAIFVFGRRRQRFQSA